MHTPLQSPATMEGNSSFHAKKNLQETASNFSYFKHTSIPDHYV